jgi:hypothetical protein
VGAVPGGAPRGPAHDPADHAEAALRYLTDPARAAAAGRAGIAAARAASWDRTADRLLDAYTHVAADHAAGADDDPAVAV